MTKIKKIFFILFTIHCSLFTVFVYASQAVKGGGYPGEYLLIFSPTAKSLAMGGVFTRSGSSLYFNPSGISEVYSKEFSFLRMTTLVGGVFSTAFFSYPLSFRRSVSLGWISCGIEGAEWVDEWGIGNRGTFSDDKQAYLIGYSFPGSRYLNVGISAKIVSQKIFNYSARSFGLDFGITYKKGKVFIPSLSIQNIVRPSLKLTDEGIPDKFPMNARVSFAFRFSDGFCLITDGVFENLMPDAGEKTLNYINAGAEVTIKEVLKLRAGYNSMNFSAGVGLNVGAVDFDWAVLFGDETKKMTAGLTIRWGYVPDLWKKKLKDRERFLKDFSKNLEIEKTYILNKEKEVENVVEDAVKVREAAAKRYIRSHEYEAALDEINAILKVQPENKTALNLKKGIKSGKLRADLSYALAMQYYRNGAYKQALKKLKKALKQNRDHKDAQFLKHMVIARIFIDKGEYYQAKSQLLEAFKIYPDNEECLTLLNGISDLLKAGGGKR